MYLPNQHTLRITDGQRIHARQVLTNYLSSVPEEQVLAFFADHADVLDEFVSEDDVLRAYKL